MTALLDTKVGQIRDTAILEVIAELERVSPVAAEHFLDCPLRLFLEQCVYPRGPEKRTPISTKLVPYAPMLETRVGKLADGALRNLCAELAALGGSGLEAFAGSKLYMLLNKTLPKIPAVKSPTARQSRWDSVVAQRRVNRAG